MLFRSDRHPVVLVEECFGIARELANELGLITGRNVRVLHLLHRAFPVVAEAHLTRGFLRLTQAVRGLTLGDPDPISFEPDYKKCAATVRKYNGPKTAAKL